MTLRWRANKHVNPLTHSPHSLTHSLTHSPVSQSVSQSRLKTHIRTMVLALSVCVSVCVSIYAHPFVTDLITCPPCLTTCRIKASNWETAFDWMRGLTTCCDDCYVWLIQNDSFISYCTIAIYWSLSINHQQWPRIQLKKSVYEGLSKISFITNSPFLPRIFEMWVKRWEPVHR